MQCEIKIQMDNDAFADGTLFELSRILKNLAQKLEDDEDYRQIMDVNGNKVGYCMILNQEC